MMYIGLSNDCDYCTNKTTCVNKAHLYKLLYIFTFVSVKLQSSVDRHVKQSLLLSLDDMLPLTSRSCINFIELAQYNVCTDLVY